MTDEAISSWNEKQMRSPQPAKAGFAMTIGEGEVFIIGGGQIFAQALPFADRLYLTIVTGDFGADTFFPEYSKFTKKTFEQKGESGEYKYSFVDLEREE